MLRNLKRVLFGTVGVLIVVGSVIWAISGWQFISRAETARGTVVKLNAGGSHPEIKFTIRDGHEISYPQGGLIFGYQVGDEVSVLYDAENPRNCQLDTFGALWGFTILTAIMGFVFIGVGLFLKS